MKVFCRNRYSLVFNLIKIHKNILTTCHDQ